MSSTLTYGMVGGGPGAFIGDAHRKAIGRGQRRQACGGMLLQKPGEDEGAGARRWAWSPARCYADYKGDGSGRRARGRTALTLWSW